MEKLPVFMLSRCVKLIVNQVYVRFYPDNAAVYENSLRYVAQVAALHKISCFSETKASVHRKRQLLRLPGIRKSREGFSIHRCCIVPRIVLQGETDGHIHIGRSAAVHQDILAVYHQIHMQLVPMAVARTHGPAGKMKQIGILFPAFTKIIIPAVLKGRRSKIRRQAGKGVIAGDGSVPEIPCAFIIQPREA